MSGADAPPAFRSGAFLRRHIAGIFAFYHPRCIDPADGFYQCFRDDGSIYDSDTRHLVGSARFVFDYALAVIREQRTELRDVVRHGLDFLRQRHRQTHTGGYAWVLRGANVVDDTNHRYGLAFVVLAYAVALRAGVDEAGDWLEETWQLLESHFWLPDYGLYRDELSADWRHDCGYRGQNANMHACEAMLAAWRASGDVRYLDRAENLAHGVAVGLANQADGLIWEHYDGDWRIDWDYNRDDPTHLFRPWGFQTGHQTEWAKLLVHLHRQRPRDWMLPRAEALFQAGVGHGWDTEHGGLVYGFDPERRVCDGHKYYWVQAESFAAAALLAEVTGKSSYWDWYERIWRFAWEYMVDHRYGAWYCILAPDNRRYDDLKSPAGKTDYHTMDACYEVIDVLDRRESSPS